MQRFFYELLSLQEDWVVAVKSDALVFESAHSCKGLRLSERPSSKPASPQGLWQISLCPPKLKKSLGCAGPGDTSHLWRNHWGVQDLVILHISEEITCEPDVMAQIETRDLVYFASHFTTESPPSCRCFIIRHDSLSSDSTDHTVNSLSSKDYLCSFNLFWKSYSSCFFIYLFFKIVSWKIGSYNF